MARTQDLERADTARPGARDKQAREIERRRRNSKMGSGAGADFADESLIPATMGAIKKTMAPDVGAAFRYIRNTAKTQDERIHMLAIILGEGGDPVGFQLEVTEADDGK